MDIKQKAHIVESPHTYSVPQYPIGSTHDCQKPQYCEEMHYPGEHIHNENGHKKDMIGNIHRTHHHAVVQSKAISHTSLAEIKRSINVNEDTTKAFGRTPKTHQEPQPNDFGNSVNPRLFKKSGRGGEQKGGIKY